MPLYKRKYAAKSKLIRRKRWARRPYRVPRTPRTGALYVVRKLSNITVQSGAGGAAGAPFLNDPSGTCLSLGTAVGTTMSNVYDLPFSLQFRLDQLMNSGELTALCDKYRIISALIKVHYNNAATPISSSGTGTSGSLPWIEYVQDHDDATVPTVATMREKMGAKNKYFSASRLMIKMGVRPLPALQVYGPAVGYSVPKRSPFINASNNNIPHFGIKGVLHSCWLPTSVVGLFEFDVSLKVALRDIQ